jgi:hypothetical protein
MSSVRPWWMGAPPVKCEHCGGEAEAVPYVGGDHDPSHECRKCGAHIGCGRCFISQQRRSDG